MMLGLLALVFFGFVVFMFVAAFVDGRTGDRDAAEQAWKQRVAELNAVEETPAKKRGRPAGSKNKSKEVYGI